MKTTRRLSVLLTLCTLCIALQASSTESDDLLLELARKAERGTGVIKTYVVPPQDYLTTLKTLAALSSSAGEQGELQVASGAEEKKTIDLVKSFTELLHTPYNGHGTGWVVEGWVVVSAHHVVEGSRYFEIIFRNGTKARLKLIGSDELSDIALLRIEDASGPVPDPIAVKPRCVPKDGEQVVSLGYSRTMGPPDENASPIPSLAFGRYIGSLPFYGEGSENQKQVDNRIISGYSGGPTLSISCGVIGINLQQSPSVMAGTDTFAEVFSDLKRYGYVPRGRIGVSLASSEISKLRWFSLQNIDPYKYPDEGILVAGVEKKGPADAAKILPGDIILAIDGKKMESGRALLREVSKRRPDEAITFKIWRLEAGEMDIRVTVGRSKKGQG